MGTPTTLYSSIYDDIIALTARPDLVAETELALRSATRSIHNRAHFPRDAVTALVKLPNPAYQVAIDIQVTFPRFRAASTVRALDVEFNPMQQPEIELVEMGDIYDPIYRILRNDIAYQAGTTLNVRSSVAASGYLVEYFASPSVAPEEYNSWIAQLAPDSIIYQAASIVAGTNGNEEKARGWQASVNQMYFPELLSNYLTTAAR